MGGEQNTLGAASEAKPVYGLVLAGGRSRRMGRDKALIVYHGRPQFENGSRALARHCARVFLSLRADQSAAPEYAGHAQLADRFPGGGPLIGILSALEAHPEAAWLVMACDLPFAGDAALDFLLARRNPLKMATAFRNPERNWPEPLLALYEPAARPPLLALHGAGLNCPRRALEQLGAELLDPPDSRWIMNANTPEEYEAALRGIPRGIC